MGQVVCLAFNINHHAKQATQRGNDTTNSTIITCCCRWGEWEFEIRLFLGGERVGDVVILTLETFESLSRCKSSSMSFVDRSFVWYCRCSFLRWLRSGVL